MTSIAHIMPSPIACPVPSVTSRGIRVRVIEAILRVYLRRFRRIARLQVSVMTSAVNQGQGVDGDLLRGRVPLSDQCADPFSNCTKRLVLLHRRFGAPAGG